MTRYLLKRLLEVIPVVIGVSLVAFAIVHLVPGDPARLLLGPQATPDLVARLHDRLGLNQPLTTQYWHFIRGAVTFDFGTSLQLHRPVAKIIGERLAPSIFLVLYSLSLALLITVPLATAAALRRGTWVDHGIRMVTSLTFVMPPFWLGLMLLLIVSVQLGLLPTSGYGQTTVEHVRSLTLPSLTIALALSPVLLRQLRASLIETLGMDYVEAARVRGLSEWRVTFKHVMRNSLTSTLTFIGLIAGLLLSQTVILENVFAIPGLGGLLVDSVTGRDFPVIQALTLLFGTAVVLISIVVDLGYAAIDPRVRL
ncbi:MAG TPA: ABC transporter permease [Conexibacter sp.]|nr:ABC transporter permease [Conexibacter sp.]